jgi:hypothetical protein
MFFVDLRLPSSDLAARMRDMRIWLDGRQIETADFFVKGAMARLAFRASQNAEAFAARFAGRIVPDPPIRFRERRAGRNDTGAPRDDQQRQLR